MELRADRIVRAGLAAETLAFALWVGGLASFAFLFAPAAFAVVPDAGVFGSLTATILGRLGTLGFACGVVIIVAELSRVRDSESPRGAILRIALVIVMLAGGSIESYVVIPQMAATAANLHGAYGALAPGDAHRSAFDALHHESSLIYGLVLLCGMAALAQLAYTEGRKDSPLPSRSSFSRRPAVRTSRL